MDSQTLQISIEIGATVVGLFFSAATLFAAIGYFKQGNNQAKIDANTLLKDDVAELTKKVTTQGNDIAKLVKQINELKLEIEEKDKKLVELLNILQGKNPDLVELLGKLRSYMDTNAPVFEKIRDKALPVLDRLEKYLDKQTF